MKTKASSPPAAAPGPLEAAARASLSRRYGRQLSDAEWDEAARALIALFTILDKWDREDRDRQARERDGGEEVHVGDGDLQVGREDLVDGEGPNTVVTPVARRNRQDGRRRRRVAEGGMT